MPANSRHQQGFTLVELLIATFIISIGILAWWKTLGGATKNRAISSDITIASELASSKMEHLALKLQTANQDSPDSDYTNIIQGVNYKLDWTITPEDAMTSVWIIDMSVTWQRYGNKTIKYQRIVTGG